MNERGCHMKDKERPYPREEQGKREGKKYKPHEQTRFQAGIVSRFSAGGLASPYSPEAHEPHSEKATSQDLAAADPWHVSSRPQTKRPGLWRSPLETGLLMSVPHYNPMLRLTEHI